MKTFRRILKLLPPAFVMRCWLKRRYGIKVSPAPGNAIIKFALAVLPYAFTAALSVRVDSDVRLLKYFLPYGRMKKFVKLAYGMQRGDATRDHGAIGALRSIMPYGLVLWWDAEDAQKATKIASGEGKAKKVPTQAATAFATVGCISESERQKLQWLDRVESMTLRIMILETGKAR